MRVDRGEKFDRIGFKKGNLWENFLSQHLFTM